MCGCKVKLHKEVLLAIIRMIVRLGCVTGLSASVVLRVVLWIDVQLLGLSTLKR